MAGVALASRVRARARGDTVAVAAWTPADLTGIQIWIRPESLGADTSLVAQWDDESGNGNHLTQGTQASQPQVVASAIDGLKAVAFDGTDNFLQSPALNLSQPGFMALVCQWPTLNNKVLVGSGADATRWQFYRGSVTQGILFVTSGLNQSIVGRAGGDWITFYLTVNGASSVVESSDGADATGNPGANGLDKIILGAHNGAFFSDCKIAEFALTTTVPTGDDRASLDSYLLGRFPTAGIP